MMRTLASGAVARESHRGFIYFSAISTSFRLNDNRWEVVMPGFIEPFLAHIAFAGLVAAQFSGVLFARRLLRP